jgi:hypothetical protein
MVRNSASLALRRQLAQISHLNIDGALKVVAVLRRSVPHHRVLTDAVNEMKWNKIN